MSQDIQQEDREVDPEDFPIGDSTYLKIFGSAEEVQDAEVANPPDPIVTPFNWAWNRSTRIHRKMNRRH